MWSMRLRASSSVGPAMVSLSSTTLGDSVAVEVTARRPWQSGTVTEDLLSEADGGGGRASEGGEGGGEGGGGHCDFLGASFASGLRSAAEGEKRGEAVRGIRR
jgi:hypothetical protein